MTEASDTRDQDALERQLGLTDGGGRRRWRRVLPVVGLLLVLAGVLPLLLRDEKGPSYLTAAAERGELTVTVTATGSLEPVNQVDVGTEVSGTIDVVAVDYNDRVSRGQVLARLDTEELEAQVLQASANLKAAEARVAQAEATRAEAGLKHQRCLALARRDMCAQDVLDSALASLQRADADLASTEAQVEVAGATLDGFRTRLEKAEIRSPIDGLVLARRIEPGQTVAASLQTPVLFVLAEDLRDMELHVDVDEADIGRVQEGQQATFTVDAYVDRRFPAQITQVRFAPDTESGVVTYETILRVDNRDLLLRPGMTATAEIVVARVADALLVPNAALRFQPSNTANNASGSFLRRLVPHPPRRESSGNAGNPANAERQIWVLDGGAPREVSVRTGLTDGVRTVVTGAISPGDSVITGMARGGPGNQDGR